MPNKNGKGPPKGATGSRDGRGKGKGNYTRTDKGSGKKTGGQKGTCK